MFDNNDDLSMNGFRKIDEPLAPWEKAPKAKAEVIEQPKKVYDTVIEPDSTPGVECAAEQSEVLSDENSMVQNGIEETPTVGENTFHEADEFMFDDADYDPASEEYMYDDAEADSYDSATNSFTSEGERCVPNNDPEIAKQAEEICRWAAARAGVVVVYPAAGTIALLANEVYMIIRLARLYGVTISEGAAAGILSSLGATFIGQTLATLFPFPPLQIPIAISVTYGTGEAVRAWLAAGRPGSVEDFKDIFKRARNGCAQHIELFENNENKDKPLGDEKKNFSDKVFDGITTGADYTSNKLKEFFGVFAEAAGEKLAELKEEHDAKVAEEKALHPEDKGLIDEVRDNYEGTVADIKQAVSDLVDGLGKEIKDTVSKKQEKDE